MTPALPTNPLDRIAALLGAASRAPDHAVRAAYLATASAELAQLREGIAAAGLLLGEAERELARVTGKAAP